MMAKHRRMELYDGCVHEPVCGVCDIYPPQACSFYEPIKVCVRVILSYPDYDRVICSWCGRKLPNDDKKVNYCPKCGAKVLKGRDISWAVYEKMLELV